MKKCFNVFVLLLTLFFLTGCPYESTVPLSNASDKIDVRLLGTWVGDDKNETYTVTKKDEFSYLIEVRKSDKAQTQNYRATITSINGTNFLSLIEGGVENYKYIFYKINFPNDNAIVINPVTENIREVFTQTSELRTFFAENMKNSYFFEKEGKLTRQTK